MSFDITDPFFPNDPYNPWTKFNSVYITLTGVPSLPGGSLDNQLVVLNEIAQYDEGNFQIDYTANLPDEGGIDRVLNLYYVWEGSEEYQSYWALEYAGNNLYNNYAGSETGGVPRALAEKTQLGDSNEQSNGWDVGDQGTPEGLESLLIVGNINDLTLMENRRLCHLGYR